MISFESIVWNYNSNKTKKQEDKNQLCLWFRFFFSFCNVSHRFHFLLSKFFLATVLIWILNSCKIIITFMINRFYFKYPHFIYIGKFKNIQHTEEKSNLKLDGLLKVFGPFHSFTIWKLRDKEADRLPGLFPKKDLNGGS